MLKKLFFPVFLVLALLPLAVVAAPPASETAPAASAVVTSSSPPLLLQTTAKQAIVVDYDTGTVLFEKNADERMPTSSMSKTMTAYMIFEALRDGRVTLDKEYPVSEKAWRMQGSKMFVELGKSIKVDDLIHGVIIQSGNDATVVLAEGLAGSEDQFVSAMNRRAAELGMMDSHFMNASGWPDPEHYSTCRDLAVLARALIHDFPDQYKYYSRKEFTYHNIKQGNRNPLLYKNIGADGIKTGHTESAGYGLMGSGVYEGRRVIIVVNGLASEKDRAEESGVILEWGMKNFENRKLLAAGQVVTTAPVALGKNKSVALAAQDDVLLTLPRMATDEYRMTAEFSSPLKAPIKKDTTVGKVVIEVPGMGRLEKPLVTAEDVGTAGFLQALVEKIQIRLGRDL